MEWLIGIAVIALLFWLFSPTKSGGPSSSQGGTSSHSPHRPAPGLRRNGEASSPPNENEKAKSTYRPTGRGANTGTKVQFNPPKGPAGKATSVAEQIKGLHDAFTGAPLSVALGLFACTACRVFYHRESVDVIRAENAGRCVACGSTSISELAAQSTPGGGRARDFDPEVVTLDSFRRHFGTVVTFEGRVVEVRVSRRGSDYAAMLEAKAWTKGLKLVFFRRSLERAGGAEFVQSLEGRRVRVRGLLIEHVRFGPEIIVSERSMILEVR